MRRWHSRNTSSARGSVSEYQSDRGIMLMVQRRVDGATAPQPPPPEACAIAQKGQAGACPSPERLFNGRLFYSFNAKTMPASPVPVP